jgi:hypothetical protein
MKKINPNKTFSHIAFLITLFFTVLIVGIFVTLYPVINDIQRKWECIEWLSGPNREIDTKYLKQICDL